MQPRNDVKLRRVRSMPASRQLLEELRRMQKQNLPLEAAPHPETAPKNEIPPESQDNFENVTCIPCSPLPPKRSTNDVAAMRSAKVILASPIRPSHGTGLSDERTSRKRQRLETIVDDAPRPQRTKRVKRARRKSSSPDRLQLSLEDSPKKRLQSVPPNAPQIVEKKGKYTFRKGVRIGDYRLPLAKLPPPLPESRQFQCRDRFDGHEIPLGIPPLLRRRPDTRGQTRRDEVSPSERLPITRRNTAPTHLSAGQIVPERTSPDRNQPSLAIKEEFDKSFEDWFTSFVRSAYK